MASLLILASLHLAAAYVASPSRTPATLRLHAKLDFEVMEEGGDFLEASSMFIDSFWADKAGQELTKSQIRELRSGQLDDFRRRYKLRKETRRRSTLFIAKDGATILGCVGVELDGAADENLVPVLSNLATARAGRRRGVATTLVREAEKRVQEWGCREMDLVVEEKNTPARNLYSKLGYAVVSKDTASDTLVPTDDGRVTKTVVTTLTMRRALGGGADLFVPAAGALLLLAGAAVYLTQN